MLIRVVHNRFVPLSLAATAAVEKALREGASGIEQGVKGRGPGRAAPIRTGNLRRSYRVSRKGVAHYEVGNDPQVANYARFVEYGTHKMSARPHLRPTVDFWRPVIISKLRAAVGGVGR